MTSQHLTSYTFDIKNMVLPHYMASVAENPDSVYYKQPVAAAPAGKKAYTRKPKAKAKKAPAKKTSTAITKAYSLDYMNPFTHEYPPADPDSFGKFVTLNNVSRFEFQTSTTKDRIFVYNPSIQGLYQLILAEDDGTVLGGLDKSPTRRFYTEPPSSSRTLRAGVKLRNLTSNQDTGGIVHVLNTSSPIETEGGWNPAIDATGPATGGITSTLAAELVASAAGGHGSCSFTAVSLQTGDNLFVIPPAGHSAYHTYDEWDNSLSGDDLARGWDRKQKNIAMNNLIIVFGKTSVVNTYEFALGIQIAAKYPMNTIISTFQKDALKSKDPDFIKKVESHVQEHGSQIADPLIAMLGGGGKKKA